MSDGFLGRWARRKLDVKREEMARQAQKAPTVQTLNLFKQGEGVATGTSNTLGVQPEDKAQTEAGTEAEIPSKAEALVLPTEADLQAVAQGGEIRGFMNPQVSGDLRNKAFKALFSQPQFNQMDFMDVYVDDYSVSKPLTAAMIDMMALGKQLLSRPDLEPKQVVEAETASGEGTHEAPSLESSETELLGEPADGLEPSVGAPTGLPVEQVAVVKNEPS